MKHAPHATASPGETSISTADRYQAVNTYADIDWRGLWHNARQKKTWRTSTVDDWNRRAVSMKQWDTEAHYANLVIEQLDLDQQFRVLDVGCGAGTLALPLAQRVREVTAIDFADAMLAGLTDAARKQKLDNIVTRCCGWADDWEAAGIERHDIAIASRSLCIADIYGAIGKLNRFAARRIYVVERIDPTPFDPDVFAAVGRPFQSGPDYIYTVNVLYSLGIHPRLEQLVVRDQTVYTTIDEAVSGICWMIKDPSDADRDNLAGFVRDRCIVTDQGGYLLPTRYPQRWALLSWDPREVPNTGT